MNWVDYAILISLALGVLHGFRQGLVRLVVGFGALIIGFFAASWFHASLAVYLRPWIDNRHAGTIIAWMLIFGGVIALGGIIAALIAKMFKAVGLSPVDRVMGAAFGGVQSAVSLVIMALMLMAFLPNRMPAAVNDSTLAPYVFGASNMLSGMTPYHIRHGVEKTYASVRDEIEKLRTLKKRLPAREE